MTEDLALKQKLFAEMEALARPDCALTSNSSSFPISEIGKGLKTQGRMMGLHFFMPAHLIPLVEVVRSVHTDREAGRAGRRDHEGARQAAGAGASKDVIGFLGNRIQGALMREALWLIEQGVASPEDIDATVRLSFGFRYAAAGPIVQKEHSGWDTTCAVAKIIWPDLSNADGPPPVLQKNVDEGRIGFKTKRGFFEWNDESHGQGARPLRARAAQVPRDLQGGRHRWLGRRPAAARGPPTTAAEATAAIAARRAAERAVALRARRVGTIGVRARADRQVAVALRAVGLAAGRDSRRAPTGARPEPTCALAAGTLAERNDRRTAR